ncbi:hypothetical protein FA95DRAFT_1485994 [Auriscalpium vulgare]|uniref:Uncharacterized protein n=1 Tax=Auriscalpium vulgare TaxID=40419 RepID=A0ACB8S4J2_9AGAM|nr:hypothetical protein FA95DRAFT_1485994 [Auriscalpium vulgare]
MRRRAPHVVDISIAGDEQEQSRIQLERNLFQTELSLHLSSAHDDYSLEYPRHQSGPSGDFPVFGSMIDRSRDDFDPEEGLSNIHAWSYRTGDDDEGINPYVGGETMSTAAHHASALTLSAGLGGRGARRDASLSGAEYDPDRPLQDLVAGLNDRLSIFDDNTRSRHVSRSVPLEPVVVDNTMDLDRVMPPRNTHTAGYRTRSPRSALSSSSSSSEPETPDPTTSRPKLSDGLPHLMFSPKRPRSPALAGSRPTSPALSYTRGHTKRSASTGTSPLYEDPQNGEPTPRPRRVHTVNSQQPAHLIRPEITVRPPTPSTANSKFTKLARNIARDIEHEQTRRNAPHEPREDAYQNITAQSTLKAKAKAPQIQKTVHLPDVTGLTSAVESPAKGGLRYYHYEDDEDQYGDGQARLHATLGLVQEKLAHLDAENNTSRRRMRELERELEECKREVARERERVMQREELIIRQRLKNEEALNSKARDDRVPQQTDEEQRRYKEAVEEKKALEALISTLRSHMTRLTTDLASHQTLLDELRSTREADSRALREKAHEVNLLRNEVEKIAGEVEVLKGVVEEGLRERRNRQERSQLQAEATQQQDLFNEGTADMDEEQSEDDEGSEQASDEEEEAHPAARVPVADRTMRTDHATLGSTPHVGGNSTRFVDDSEVDRISAELEERRSERSMSRNGGSASGSQSSIHSRLSSRAPSLASSASRSERSVRSSKLGPSLDDDDAPPRLQTRSAPAVARRTEERGHRHASGSGLPSTSHPPAAPPSRHRSDNEPHVQRTKVSAPSEDRVESPFPQIRGEQLERLFFSAPDHNVKTCTVCRRRQPSDWDADAVQRPLWYPASRGKTVRIAEQDQEDVDEGFAEGSEPAEEHPVGRAGKGKAPVSLAPNLQFLSQNGRADRLPPQTVLVRVLRELEDDFTHYKGIYTELADQYKLMDPASNVAKRNVLAQHLREVIDILEQKGDQIASLYDLLTFEDKPVGASVVPEKKVASASRAGVGRSRVSAKHLP